MRDDDDEQPLYLGVGACHELVVSKPKRKPKQSRPIGFITFPDKPTVKKPTRPVAQKRRTRRK